ncbi:uncharacterized protein LOC129136311 [Pan troglodytes]|uniref:uncharacterized protein LOC129136311 n=1 Tax=Pan troglodytes TaxID=9598 RepID=UPI00004E8BF0|nr:uncharacterized protein LOC129136311 [Pan troglodytes]
MVPLKSYYALPSPAFSRNHTGLRSELRSGQSELSRTGPAFLHCHVPHAHHSSPAAGQGQNWASPGQGNQKLFLGEIEPPVAPWSSGGWAAAHSACGQNTCSPLSLSAEQTQGIALLSPGNFSEILDLASLRPTMPHKGCSGRRGCRRQRVPRRELVAPALLELLKITQQLLLTGMLMPRKQAQERKAECDRAEPGPGAPGEAFLGLQGSATGGRSPELPI